MATEGASNVQVYMQVEANGEALSGNSADTKNHDGWNDVYAFTYEMARNADKTTGMVTGRVFQGQFNVRKPIDKSTPLLLKALSNNEEVKVTLELWRDKPAGGGREKFFTLVLEKGRLTSIRPEANADLTNDSNNPYVESLNFVGEVIVMTYVDGGIEHQHNFKETA
jgi:type VI secretion system Hcp family effector